MKIKVTQSHIIELDKGLKSQVMKRAWSYYPSMKDREIEELKSRYTPEQAASMNFGVDKDEVFSRCLKKAINQLKATERSRLALSGDPREGSKTQCIREMLMDGKNPQQIVDELNLTTIQFVYNQRTLLRKKGALS